MVLMLTISVSSNVITFESPTTATNQAVTAGEDLQAGKADITFKSNAIGDIFGTSDGAEVTSYGSIKLDSTGNSPIKIDLGEVTTAANPSFSMVFWRLTWALLTTMWDAPQLSASGGTSMSGLSVGTASAATAALSTLDRAIDAVNANRGTLGALQNRLESTQSTTCHPSRMQQVAQGDGSWTLILPRKLLS